MSQPSCLYVLLLMIMHHTRNSHGHRVMGTLCVAMPLPYPCLLHPCCVRVCMCVGAHVCMQLLAGSRASKYRAAMSALRQPDLARLMYHLSQHNLLQCKLLDSNGNLVLIIHSVQHDMLRR